MWLCRAAFQCKDWARLAQLMDENFELRRYDDFNPFIKLCTF